MASLKETKTRIASVKSTLQITSAMKMVSASKLHHAQQAIGNMVPYQEKLHGILGDLLTKGKLPDSISNPMIAGNSSGRVAVVAFSSNSALCGGYNSVAVKSLAVELQSLEKEGLSREDIDIYAVGRKIADAVRKWGLKLAGDYSHLVDKPNYEDAAAFARILAESYSNGQTGRVILLYNHYKSNAAQPPQKDTYLPLALNSESRRNDDDLIVEPDASTVLQSLIPKILLLKMYTVVLDSYAAEHAARTVAMQLASDNADELLSSLTLEYNKRRQQAITNELLDIVGGTLA